ncbi:hypothetical protein [Flavicella sediminum]|uniref:hypothetical protein n=1 Tax=Flavicella sediminum TaxID=2585141 RepID=UPI0011216334|nr:hypothetical protein [Flavicella sediminum]
MKNLITLSVVLILLTSCASKYELLNPKRTLYQSINKDNNIEVSYKYNTLRKKYRKYAEKNDIRIVSVKIKNNTERDIVFGTDFNLVSYSDRPLNILAPNEAYDNVRQHPASHLWYLLLAPVTLNKTESESFGGSTITKTKPIFPIGLILGPAISLGNMVYAGKSNKKFKQELNDLDLTNKTIKKGETVFGLISIRQSDYPSIKASIL